MGLVLVVVGGAELFTGNNLIVMAWASRRISTASLIRNWVVVYLGNFVGAVGIALLASLSGVANQAGGAVGRTMVSIAQHKCQLPWHQAFFVGIGSKLVRIGAQAKLNRKFVGAGLNTDVNASTDSPKNNHDCPFS